MQDCSAAAALVLVFFCHHIARLGAVDGAGHVAGRKYYNEGEDGMLDCPPASNVDLLKTALDWKNGPLEVFLYTDGQDYNNGLSGQDKRYEGRVSLFREELKNGNGSIVIRALTPEDSGNYTCILPHHQPRLRFTIELIVAPTLKNRLRQDPGAVHPPYVKIHNDSAERVVLECKALGSSSEPSLLWKTCDGTVLHAEEPHISKSLRRFDATLLIAINKTTSDRCFRCEVAQADIRHVIREDIVVPDKLFETMSCKSPKVPVDRWSSLEIGLLVSTCVFGPGFCLTLVLLLLKCNKRPDANRLNRYWTGKENEVNGRRNDPPVQDQQEMSKMIQPMTRGPGHPK